jgi:hypothetical protein
MRVEYIVLFALVWLTFISLLGVIAIYGLLTPWYKSRTGIGFMSTKVAFAVAVGLTLMAGYGLKPHLWVAYAAWCAIIVALNWGITWNIIYKQFIENRSDEMKDKTTSSEQRGVTKGTGERRTTKGHDHV